MCKRPFGLRQPHSRVHVGVYLLPILSYKQILCNKHMNSSACLITTEEIWDSSPIRGCTISVDSEDLIYFITCINTKLPQKVLFHMTK